ncbi:hypothetical protein AMAG_20424 [Allomyces macrogynus ATCC 38327]|uniref:Uncharacterized protein n=1 Tax=Allomyces macrogynus (strain ATCC 38327) TaxID=578462 RepID=A0A0L0TBA8_ALLM3|nr:hypothetical protein AMAG_20424 [Allomyces macrogynus ATCC 38327]|eukprot:KNE71996.1 hypothetical protein AMAG_20424 [Allomyces macrogynus ATCC 38327]
MIRVYGLPLDFSTSLVTTGATLAISLGLVLVVAACQRRAATRAMLQVVPEPPALDGVPPVGAGLAAMMPVQQVSRPSSAARAVGLSRPGSGKGRVEMAGAPAPGAPDVMRAEKDLDKGSSTALAGASAAGAGTVPPLRAILRTRPVIPEDEEQMMGSGET